MTDDSPRLVVRRVDPSMQAADDPLPYAWTAEVGPHLDWGWARSLRAAIRRGRRSLRRMARLEGGSYRRTLPRDWENL